MLRASLRGALIFAAIGAVLTLPACGKKAPLRLTDDRAAERAPGLSARVREGRVSLDFRVPAHRFFPEREEPWVLARILRLTAPDSEYVEAGVVLKEGGFAFDSPLRWTDEALPAKQPYVYRVEFRDAQRRRRALSEPLAVSWDQVPGAPSNLNAAGHLRSIVLTWTAPVGAGAAVTYLVYRRERAGEQVAPVSPEPVAECRFVDSRIESGREYCYAVRAVLGGRNLPVEGPAGPESCSRAAAEEVPRPQPPAAGP